MKKFEEPVGRKVYGNFFKDGYFEGRESGSIIPPAYGYYVIPEKDWISQHRILLALLADREQLRDSIRHAYNFLSRSNECESNCDSATNFHTPECAIEQDFYWALKKSDEVDQ